jgi:hypothetical protein
MLDGNVTQDVVTSWFSPTITVNYNGNPAIEERVVKEAASFGRQLGWLMEIVLALAKNQGGGLPAEAQQALTQLTAAKVHIDKIKGDYKTNALADANDVLNYLAETSPGVYEAIINAHHSGLKQK